MLSSLPDLTHEELTSILIVSALRIAPVFAYGPSSTMSFSSFSAACVFLPRHVACLVILGLKPVVVVVVVIVVVVALTGTRVFGASLGADAGPFSSSVFADSFDASMGFSTLSQVCTASISLRCLAKSSGASQCLSTALSVAAAFS